MVDPLRPSVWPPVPQDVLCRESTRFGKTLWEYAPASRALMGYKDDRGHLAGGYRQIIDRVEEVLLK